MSLAKSDAERKRLIRKSGLSQKDFLALRRYYISCKKEVYGSDVKLKDIETFAEYIIYMSKLSWRGILLTLFFSSAFSLYDVYNYGPTIRSLVIFLLFFVIIFFCVIKANGDSVGLRMKTTVKLLTLRLLVVFKI